jgi:hypothetical protein
MPQGGVGVLVRRDSFCHLTRNPIFSLLVARVVKLKAGKLGATTWYCWERMGIRFWNKWDEVGKPWRRNMMVFVGSLRYRRRWWR